MAVPVESIDQPARGHRIVLVVSSSSLSSPEAMVVHVTELSTNCQIVVYGEARAGNSISALGWRGEGGRELHSLRHPEPSEVAGRSQTACPKRSAASRTGPLYLRQSFTLAGRAALHCRVQHLFFGWKSRPLEPITKLLCNRRSGTKRCNGDPISREAAAS